MTEKKRTRKPKRDIELSVDLPNADVTIKRDADGDIHAELDSKKVDVTVEKTAEKLTINVEINDETVYEFESNGQSKHMAKGQVFKIAGKLARYFIQRGFGRIKN